MSLAIMAVFAYRALNDQAAVVEGTIAVDTARAARDALRLRGLIVESVATTTGAGAGNASIRLPFRGRQRYGAKRVAMVRELSTLLAAGIPLLESIDSLVLQQTGGFKQSMMILRDRISAGGSLADVMREQPTVFDPLSIHMVEVGENSGTLDIVLDQFANFSERYLQLKDRVTNACPCEFHWRSDAVLFPRLVGTRSRRRLDGPRPERSGAQLAAGGWNRRPSRE